MVTQYKTSDVPGQRAFRAILDGFSRPGRIENLYDRMGEAPAQDRFKALLVILDALLDREVSHAVLPGDRPSPSLGKAIITVTGSPAATPKSADYIIAPSGVAGEILEEAKRGTPEYPDRSATVIYMVDDIAGDDSPEPLCMLQGPGILGRAALPLLRGLDYGDLARLNRINQSYPLGIDMIAVDGKGRMVAIPRSSKITLQEDGPWPTRQ